MCTVTFDGTQFLTAAFQRGISARTPEACAVIRLPANQFFAPPNADCSVLFENSTWLQPTAQFVALRGAGTFTATKTQTGIRVSIAANAGFRLENITVKTPGSDCTEIEVDTVLL
jgi:hypothetical protein